MAVGGQHGQQLVGVLRLRRWRRGRRMIGVVGVDVVARGGGVGVGRRLVGIVGRIDGTVGRREAAQNLGFVEVLPAMVQDAVMWS